MVSVNEYTGCQTPLPWKPFDGFILWMSRISLLFQFRTYPLSAAMKIFKLSEVESVAIRKWGSMEKLEAQQEKRKQQNSKLERKNEEEKRHFWDNEEIFKPLEHFMVNLELPEERVSCYFREKIDDILGEC